MCVDGSCGVTTSEDDAAQDKEHRVKTIANIRDIADKLEKGEITSVLMYALEPIKDDEENRPGIGLHIVKDIVGFTAAARISMAMEATRIGFVTALQETIGEGIARRGIGGLAMAIPEVLARIMAKVEGDPEQQVGVPRPPSEKGH